MHKGLIYVRGCEIPKQRLEEEEGFLWEPSLQNTPNLNLRNKNNGSVFTAYYVVNSAHPPHCREPAPRESLSLRQIITFSVLSPLPARYHFTLLLKLT